MTDCWPNVKRHFGALTHPVKRRKSYSRSGTNGLAIIRAAFESCFAENEPHNPIMLQ